MNEELKDLRETFWKIFAIYTAVSIALFGYLFSEVQETKLLGVKLDTQLAQIQSDIADIKIALKEHSE